MSLSFARVLMISALSTLDAMALSQAPEWFMAAPLSNAVVLTWSEVPGATGYVVGRSASAAGLLILIATNGVETSFTDTSARNNSAYFYSITALDADGAGAATVRLRAAPSAAVLDWLPAGAKAEKLAGNFLFTEGPIWMREGFLVFSDIQGNRLYRWTEAEGSSIFRTNSSGANGNTLDLLGRLITCEHNNRRVSRTETNGTVTALVTNYNGIRFNAPNDVAVKSDGTIWFTDPNYGLGQLQPGRYVFRFHPDDPTNTLRTVAVNFDQPNGIAFSKDEKKVYIADSGTPRHVRVFDVLPNNTLTNSKVFTSISAGNPDGMRVDDAGRLYVTTSEGVQIFSPEGQSLDRIRTPETAANVSFGGTNNDQIFITANTSLYGITRKPDLVITALQLLPGNARPGQEVRFLCVVKNQGTAATPQEGSNRVSISIGNETNVFASEPFALAADASILLTIPNELGTPWKAISGANRIYAVADFENRLIESNERNNTTNIAVTSAAPSPDTDGDGSADADEVLAGTDPAAASSVLKILSTGLSPDNQVILQWASRPNANYLISTKRSIENARWIDFPTPISSAGDTTGWTNSIRDRALFRVRVAP